MEQIALLISFIRRYAGFWKEGGGCCLLEFGSLIFPTDSVARIPKISIT